MSGEILLIDGPGGLALRLVGALRRLDDEIPLSEASRTARTTRKTTLADPPTPDDRERIGEAVFIRLTSG